MNQFTGGNNANYNAATYEIGEQDYTGIGTAAPGAGTYNVGYCVQNYGDEDLDNNNWANGYVEVVDGTPNTSGVSQAPRASRTNAQFARSVTRSRREPAPLLSYACAATASSSRS